jgi:hypothetical protein
MNCDGDSAMSRTCLPSNAIRKAGERRTRAAPGPNLVHEVRLPQPLQRRTPATCDAVQLRLIDLAKARHRRLGNEYRQSHSIQYRFIHGEERIPSYSTPVGRSRIVGALPDSVHECSLKAFYRPFHANLPRSTPYWNLACIRLPERRPMDAVPGSTNG